MSQKDTQPRVELRAGALRGFTDRGVQAFLGVPFAAPVVGSRRFAPPSAVEPWDGDRDATVRPVAPPQMPSRLKYFMGELAVPGYGEDCLTLNVWSPSTDPDAKLPVLIFFHGGAWLSGAGVASWYDGAVMAQRGEMVVVTANYRLGALGWLYLPRGTGNGKPVANLGMQDMMAALNWVQDNINQFGGDPTNVTAAGQSAGGQTIAALMTAGAAGSFQRAIIDSVALGDHPFTPEQSERATQAFFKAAGLPPTATEDLLNLPVSQLLEAQGEINRQAVVGELDLGDVPFRLPLEPMFDGVVMPVDYVDAAFEGGSLDDLPIMFSHTSDESRAWLANDAEFWGRDRESIARQITSESGAESAALYGTYADLLSSSSPAEAWAEMISDENFVFHQLRLAERKARHGVPAYFMWFSWQSPAADGRLAAAHTVDMPFVFKNFSDWPAAPMLAGVSQEELEHVSTPVQDAWISFARNGAPAVNGGPDWPPFTTEGQHAMEFNTEVRLVSGLRRDRRDLRRAAEDALTRG